MTDFEKMQSDPITASTQNNTAPLWKRLLAAFIDFFIASSCTQLFVDAEKNEQLYNAFVKYGFIMPPEVAEQFVGFQIQNMLIFFVTFLVLNIFFLHQRGQTIGKVVMKIAIRDLENNKPSLAHLIVVRYLVQVPMVLLTIPSILDFIFIIVRNDRRSIHDLLAKTKVIDLKIRVAESAPTFMA